jgi:hypothetical protein
MSLGVLLAGALGALLVFFLGVLREWWREEQKRRWLLCLLRAEINHNEIVIKVIAESGSSLETSPYLDNLKTETWDESRGAASGLPTELLNDLNGYYEPLEIFRTIKSLPPKDPNRTPSGEREMIEMKLDEMTEPLNQVLSQWGFPTTRRETYQQSTLRASTRVKKSIETYLDRPLWAPPILWAERWAVRLRQKRS